MSFLQINTDDLIDFKISQVDQMGKIYRYKNEFIRIINPSKKELVQKLFDSGCINRLIEERMIPNTRISNYKLNSTDDMIIVSDAIITDVTEEYWSYDMIRDAGLLTLSLDEMLNLYGFALNDVNIHNVLFDGCTPMWVDIGSFDYLNDKTNRVMKDYFWDNYIYPLKIIDSNFKMSGFVSSFFSENWIGRNDFRQMKYLYCGIKNAKKMDKIKGIKIKYLTKKEKTRKEIIESCRKELAGLELKGSDTWGRYQDSMWAGGGTTSAQSRFSDSIDIIRNNTDNISSMLEIGGNEGYFGFLCGEQHIAEYIYISDYSYEAINKAYWHLKKDVTIEKSYKIIPALLDFVAIDNGRLSLFKADLVVANALTHHLLLRQNVNMKSLFKKMSICCEKYLLIEFMPLGLWTPESGSIPLPEWYTFENFCNEMSEIFEILEYRQIDTNRIAIIGKK